MYWTYITSGEIRQRKERRRKKIIAEKRSNIDKRKGYSYNYILPFCYTVAIIINVNKFLCIYNYPDTAAPPSNTFDTFPSIGFVLSVTAATSSVSPEFTHSLPEGTHY